MILKRRDIEPMVFELPQPHGLQWKECPRIQIPQIPKKAIS